MDLIDTSRKFYPIAIENTFFSAAHGTFSKIDHILGCKASITNTKKLK
jgi:hypothetical protein